MKLDLEVGNTVSLLYGRMKGCKNNILNYYIY
jgi:hypothetical protein